MARGSRLTRPFNAGLIAPLISTGIIGIKPSITFPDVTLLESASVGSTVAALSILNPIGLWSFTKTADPDGKFSVASNGNVTLAAVLDYETKTSHTFSVAATNGLLTLNFTGTVNVSNVLEGTLAPTTANMVLGAAAGTVVATVSGLDAGANETVTGVNDTRFVIASGNRVVASATPTTAAGTINLTVTTSAGRQLALAVTVAAAASGALTMTNRTVLASSASGTAIDAVSGLRSGSILSLPTVTSLLSVSGANVAKGTRSHRAGYFTRIFRDTATDGSTIDTPITFKTPRESKTVVDFENLATTAGWAYTSGAEAKFTPDTLWNTSGRQSLNIAQPAAAANQTLAATRTLDEDLAWGLDEIYTVDFNNKGVDSPSNISVRFVGASGNGPWINVSTIGDIRRGVQPFTFTGRDMTANSSSLPDAFTGPVKKVVFVAGGAGGTNGWSVSFDNFRRVKKVPGPLMLGMDDAFAAFADLVRRCVTNGLRPPYKSLFAGNLDKNNASTPLLKALRLQQLCGYNKLCESVGAGTYAQVETDPATAANVSFKVGGTGFDANNYVKLQKQETDGSWTDMVSITSVTGTTAAAATSVAAGQIQPRQPLRHVIVGAPVITYEIVENTFAAYQPKDRDYTIGGMSTLTVAGTGLSASNSVTLQKRNDDGTWSDLATVTAAGTTRLNIPVWSLLRVVVAGSATGVTVTLRADLGAEVINHTVNHPLVGLHTLYNKIYADTSGTDAVKAAAAEAAIVAEVEGCRAYAEGKGATVKNYYTSSGSVAATPTDTVMPATGVDISTRTLPNGRACKSSMFHMILPGGDFNTGVLSALRKTGMRLITSINPAEFGAWDGFVMPTIAPRRSFNWASSDAANIRAALRWLQRVANTGQMADAFWHDLGGADYLTPNPDGVMELRKTSIGTQPWAFDKLWNGWVDTDGVTPLKGILQLMAEGALISSGKTEAIEGATVQPLPNVGFNMAGGDFSTTDPKDDFSEYKNVATPERDPVSGQALRGNGQWYVWPKKVDIDYVADRAANLIRIPFRYHHLWNVDPSMDPTLDTVRVYDHAQLKIACDAAEARGMTIVVDDHNYGYKSFKADPGSTTASDHDADKFYQDTAADRTLLAERAKRIATFFKDYTRVRYTPMNEPTGKANAPSTVGLYNLYQVYMDAVRTVDTNPLHVFQLNANHYASPDAYTKVFTGQTSSSATEFLRLVDSTGAKPISELHPYIDADTRNGGANIASSHPGKEENPVIVDFADSPATFTYNGTTYSYAAVAQDATNHARQFGYKLYAGEYAVKSEEPVFVNEGRRLHRFFVDNRDVWDGAAYWGAGPWWPKPNDPVTGAQKVFSPLPMDRTSTVHRGAMDMLSEFMPVVA
ncbi:cellulase family glycosylhydrolase [Aureimonas psammosilenae]|uniref:cellulase family glycosylhydrolase n=1 Tax=Aureimonas psammosilenae TaxID=2495496 RepID=UPI0012609BB8|nr:cellulase family glycosylhydrolase [Aureimonas psammosilenae]